MNKWYISIQNKARGPFTDLQMKKKIEDGEIEGLTLTYREGDTDWLALEKQDVWIENKKKTEKSTYNSLDTDWILLVENPDKKGQFLQKGPYSDADVRALISKGEVHLKDYCWKPGMKDWKLLFETVELGLSRKPKIEFTLSKPLAMEEVSLSENLSGKQEELELEPLPQLEMELKDDSIDHFQALTEQLEINKADVGVNEFTLETVEKENFSIEPDKTEDVVVDHVNKERKSFLSNRVLLSFFTLALFAFGIFYGVKSPNTLIQPELYSLGSFVSGVSNIKDLFNKPEVPKASYVLIKQLYSNPKSILVRSDAKSKQIISVSVLGKNGDKVSLKSKDDSLLKVEANIFGEAFIDMELFDIKEDVEYTVSAEIGNLKAEKKYIYGIKKADENPIEIKE